MHYTKKIFGFLIEWLIIKPVKWSFDQFANLFVKLLGKGNLIATPREKEMIKFFLLVMLTGGLFYMPFTALTEHINYFHTLESTVKNQFHTEVASAQKKVIAQSTQKEIGVYEVISETIREVTAYNVGDPAQTDDSPCKSANGENICLALEKGYNRCAANFVPFGTQLLIYSKTTGWSFHCTVTDRMNSRYSNRVDIAMNKDEKERAKAFGLQLLSVRILEKK